MEDREAGVPGLYGEGGDAGTTVEDGPVEEPPGLRRGEVEAD